MKAYFRVYAFMFVVDILILGLISWLATIPLSTLWTFVPLAAVMFSIAAYITYKLELRGIWWLLVSLVICDAFINVQFVILTEGKMSLVDVFREIHYGRITFFVTLVPEIVAHIAGAFAWRIVRRNLTR